MVGMGRVAINFDYLGGDSVIITKDRHRRLAVYDFPAQGILRLIPYKEDSIPGVFYIVFEMMQDASVFTHTGSADNHRRAFPIIERLGLFDIPNIGDALKAKRVGVAGAQHKIPGLLVIEFGMKLKNLGDAYRQGTINKYINRRNFSGFNQAMQGINQVLSPSY